MENKIEFLLNDIENKIKLNPNQPELWIEKGLLLSKVGLLEKSLNSFDKALELAPNSEIAKINKATIYLKLNKEQETLKIIEEVISVNPNNKNAWLIKGLSLIELSSIEEVEKCFDKSLEIDNNFINAWFKKLEINKFIRNHHQIEFCLNNIRRLIPDKIDYWSELGIFFIETNQLEKANNFYDELLKLNYKPDLILSKKSEIFFKQKQYHKAIEVINESLNLNPDNDEALSQKANIYYSSNDLENAKNIYDKALQINPKNLKALLGMGEILFKEQKYQLSFNCFKKITEIHPSSFIAWNKLGMLLELQNQWQEAIECYSKAIYLNENFLLALYNKAHLLFKSQEYLEALKTSDQALLLKANDLPLLQIKADCLKGLKSYEQSLEIYKRIVELNPNDIDSIELLANNFILLGKDQEAINILESILEKESNRKTIWYALGIAYHREKNLKKALESQLKAISIDPGYSEAIDSKSLIEKEINIAERKNNDKPIPHIKNIKEIKICPQCGLDLHTKTCSNCYYYGESITPISQDEQIERLNSKNIQLVKRRNKTSNTVTAETYFSIIFQPTQTFNTILNKQPINMRPIFLLLVISNLSSTLSFLNPNVSGYYSKFISLPFAFLFSFILSIILASIEFFVAAPLIKLPGNMIGGKASTEEIKAVLGWANIPKTLVLLFSIIFLVLSQTNLISTTQSPLVCLCLASIIPLFIWIWHIILFYKFLAQAQRFSFLKAIVSFFVYIIIVSLCLGLLSMIIVMLITIFLKGKIF